MPPSLLSRLSSLRTRSSRDTPYKTHITDGPDLPKTEIGPAKDFLEKELLRLYWDGVKQDLPHIISTLRNSLPFDNIFDGEANVVHDGYDTWVDNITKATKYPPAPAGSLAIDAALRQHAWNTFEDVKRQRVRGEIRSNIKWSPPDDVLKQRARLLLQSAQWLDIDKLIEHRDPPSGARLAPANLTTGPSKVVPPPFETRRCHECNKVMRGSVFKKISVVIGPKPDQPGRLAHPIICESCYCNNHYGEEGFTKEYKQSPLPGELCNRRTPKACRCYNNGKEKSNGAAADLPVNDTQQHWGVNCPIAKLRDDLAEAKFDSTWLGSEPAKSLTRYQKIDAEQDLKTAIAQWKAGKKRGPKPKLGDRKIDETTGEFELDGLSAHSGFSTTPGYLRPASPKNPWGLVHMALRVGPLVIENGVKQ